MNPRTRHAVLGAGLAGAVLLVAFGDRTPPGEVAEAVERPARRAGPAPAPLSASASTSPSGPAAAPGTPAEGTGQQILALVPRTTLIGDPDERFGSGDGAGPFGRHDWTPPAPPPAAAAAVAPPAPTAPPLPFTFIGKSVGDGVWEVYLARGDRTYVVRDKDVIDGTYRVDAIAPPVLTLTYLPLNTVQQLNIGVFD